MSNITEFIAPANLKETPTPETAYGEVINFPSAEEERQSCYKKSSYGRQYGAVSLAGMISPGTASTREVTPPVTMTQKTADPIKSLDDIDKICKFLLEKKRYRDYMLFVVGINFGLRIGDLLHLKFSDLITNDLTFKDSFEVLEQKTSNTRKNRRLRYVTINDAAKEAVELYIRNSPEPLCLDDYLFRSQGPNRTGSKRGYETGKSPLTTVSVNRILKKIAKDCGVGVKMSSHTLRKTFGYHQMAMSGHDPRKLTLLSKMYGHSDLSYTMMYIGLTREEMRDAYLNLNLGGDHYTPVEEENRFVGQVRFYG